ncbi:hypothetical protein RD792_006899 [Penstemon davidsonii]|uniref:Helicase ATP-binding domain-containing protein n=1 Tax=Penstemon davidsonii TaxID=160366 RepID=A0ABR0D557_9LAMI|nr:hypothetical protein RD792_006899 [Penstemon davidsonii]
MGNFLLKRSSSSILSKRLVLSTLNHFFLSSESSNALISPHIYTYATTSSNLPKPSPSLVFSLTRGFHSSRPVLVELAVTGYYDSEDKRASCGDEGLEISKLGISQDIVSALEMRGIFKLFPIQSVVLEPTMQGRDMIGRARTGTGKTLAFGIPIMDKIIQFNVKHRELARQVEKEFVESAPKLDTMCVYGGVPLSRQMSTLDHGVDVVVGTPGRVIDLIKRGSLNLTEVKFVALDEADQMLNVGFADDNQRERTLSSFRDGHISILVATDVTARGLDVPNVDLLPRIAVEEGALDAFRDSDRSSRFGDYGFGRGGRSGGYGNSGGGRFGWLSSGCSGGYGSGGGGFGGQGSCRSSSGFGSGRLGGFGSDLGGNSDRSSGFGNFGGSSSSRSSGYGKSQSGQGSRSSRY